jgi:hypothetical protein
LQFVEAPGGYKRFFSRVFEQNSCYTEKVVVESFRQPEGSTILGVVVESGDYKFQHPDRRTSLLAPIVAARFSSWLDFLLCLK